MGGGKGGGGEAPYSQELGQMLFANMAGSALQRSPWMAPAFNKDSKLGQSFRDLMPGVDPSTFASRYPAPKMPTESPIASAASRQFNQSLFGGGDMDMPTSGGATVQSPAGYGGLRPKTQSSGKSGGSGGGQFGGGGASASYSRGGGTMSPTPTGQSITGTLGNSYQFSTPSMTPTSYTGANISAPQTTPVTALTVPNQMFTNAAQLGQEQIGRAARTGMQELSRQFGARGLGRSGIALNAASQGIQQGALQQGSQLGRELAGQKMSMEFGEGQQARGLELQRQLSQGGMNLQAQQMAAEQAYRQAGLNSDEAKFRATQDLQRQQLQAGENLSRGQLGLAGRAQALQESMGMGQLGLAERAQQLQELMGSQKYGDVMTTLLSGLGQSLIGASASQAGGKK